jgi:hypothetical protein
MPRENLKISVIGGETAYEGGILLYSGDGLTRFLDIFVKVLKDSCGSVSWVDFVQSWNSHWRQGFSGRGGQTTENISPLDATTSCAPNMSLAQS